MEKEAFLKLAENHGISSDEAERVYDSIIIVAEKVKQVVSEVWELIRPIAEYLDAEKEKYEYNYSNYFAVTLDTRKKSQVICNKPRFMVRKVI